jgi:hypothetical protein
MEQVVQITAVEVLEGHVVRVSFNDGVVRDVDIGRQLGKGPIDRALRDPVYFASVRLDKRSDTIVWPNGAHFHSDFLHGDYDADR